MEEALYGGLETQEELDKGKIPGEGPNWAQKKVRQLADSVHACTIECCCADY